METVEKNCLICDAVKKWLQRPFKEDGSVLDWFLFIGLVGILSYLWTLILKRIV